jgi:hypothetical protein
VRRVQRRIDAQYNGAVFQLWACRTRFTDAGTVVDAAAILVGIPDAELVHCGPPGADTRWFARLTSSSTRLGALTIGVRPPPSELSSSETARDSEAAQQRQHRLSFANGRFERDTGGLYASCSRSLLLLFVHFLDAGVFPLCDVHFFRLCR